MKEYENDREDKEHPLHSEIRRWKRHRDRYFEVCKRAEQLYWGEDISAYVERPAQLNLFWSIVNTLKPALYAQPPRPLIERRYPSRDITSRIAAQVLERCTTFEIERSNYDAVVSTTIDDYLVVGQGTVWVRYEPIIGQEVQRIPVQEVENEAPTLPAMPGMPEVQGEMPETQEGMGNPESGGEYEGAESEYSERGRPEREEEVGTYFVDEMGQLVDSKLVKQDDQGYYIDGEIVETLIDERTFIDYVHWSDFLFEPARVWSEVQRVARKVHISKKEFISKFGEEVYRNYSYAQERAESDAEREINRGKICVYEMWDKTEQKVYWIAEGYNEILKESEPYLKFDNFFPCPEPLFSTLSAGLIPRPDITFYQDQQETIHYLCQKTQDIAKYIKVLSVGGSENPELNNLLRQPNGSHIQLSNFQMYLQQGGVKSSFEVLSMAEHASILRVLHDALEQEKNQVYDITGIADIIRGVSSASETLGAQQIKSQYATARISARQRKVAIFCNEIVRLIAQVIKNHYQTDTIVRMAGVGNDNEAMEFIAAAADLLKNDVVSDYRIEIETDSTKFTDIETAKQSAIDLTNALAQMFNALLPHTQSIPELVPVIAELTLYTAKQFEAGRQVSGKLEEAMGAVEKTVEMNKQMEEQRKAEEAAMEQQRVQNEQQMAQAQAQAQAVQAQQAGPDTKLMEMEQKKLLAEAELQLKLQKQQAEEEMERQKIALADDRERKAESLKHEREMIKFQLQNAQKLDLMAPRQRTRTGRIGLDENGQKVVIVEDIEDVAPEVKEIFAGIRGLTGK
jgi:hypothetical protein